MAKGKIIGYIRVSTLEQNEGRQLEGAYTTFGYISHKQRTSP